MNIRSLICLFCIAFASPSEAETFMKYGLREMQLTTSSLKVYRLGSVRSVGISVQPVSWMRVGTGTDNAFVGVNFDKFHLFTVWRGEDRYRIDLSYALTEQVEICAAKDSSSGFVCLKHKKKNADFIAKIASSNYRGHALSLAVNIWFEGL